MEDRELLELAAKAAGIYDEWPKPDYDVQVDESGVFCGGMGESLRWNPLTDDGDALRLAVACGLVVDTSRPSAGEPLKLNHYGQEDFTDRNAATRRAIVRAAAEIGRSMNRSEG